MDSNILKAMPIRLHAELCQKKLSHRGKRLLRRYAESTDEGTLTRDFLIPEDMTLHSIHYLLQQAFGWQNCHHRSFHLREGAFNRVTENSFERWKELIGVLFRSPVISGRILYWDEDYVGGDIKDWLKSKYTGPYGASLPGEDYEMLQQSMDRLIERVPEITVEKAPPNGANGQREKTTEKIPIQEASLEELKAAITFEGPPDQLLESLQVRSVLRFPVEEDSEPSEGPELSEESEEGEDPGIFPVTDVLIYRYDYGDDWVVYLTLLPDWEDLLEDNVITGDELVQAERTVSDEHRPICMARRGMNVMDDIGGLEGFSDFLEIIYESKDRAEVERYLTAAERLGWDTKKTSPFQTV